MFSPGLRQKNCRNRLSLRDRKRRLNVIEQLESVYLLAQADKSVRQSSVERLKYTSGLQLLFGLGITVCAIIAHGIKDEGVNFSQNILYAGGVAGAIAGIWGLYTVYKYKASNYNGDDLTLLRKELQFTVRFQTILGYIVFAMSISGIVFNIISMEYDNDDETEILLACILTGIILLLIVTILACKALGTCCQHQGFNRTMVHTTYPNTAGEAQNYQGQPAYGQQQVYSTGGFNQGSSQQQYPPPYDSLEMGQKTQYGVQPEPTAPPPPYSY